MENEYQAWLERAGQCATSEQILTSQLTHFGDRPFLAIYCTGNDKQTHNQNQKETDLPYLRKIV